MFYNYSGDSMKRRIRYKRVFFVIFIFLLIVLGIFIFFNVKKDNKETIDKVGKENIEEPKNKKMSIVMVGDVLIHESVYKDAYDGENYDFSSMFSYIGKYIKDYDLKFCNQESIIGGYELGIGGYPNFNSPDEIGEELVSLGFNMISLANNHAYDKGENAILYSNSFWNTKDVITSGTSSSKEERDNIKVYTKNGIKYAFISYTTSLNGYNLPKGKEYLVNMYEADIAKRDIESIKDKVDVVIISMHWGVEYDNSPTTKQKEIAEYLSSLGANLIIGHHPHVVQPIEYINDTLVIYSLGNFISNQLVLGENQAIGLMLGLNINVDDKSKVTFTDINYELVYSYSLKSTKFKVVPFSEMKEEYLNNYEMVKEKYMNIVKLK